MDPVSARGLASVSIPQYEPAQKPGVKEGKGAFKEMMNDSTKTENVGADTKVKETQAAENIKPQKVETQNKVDTFVDAIRKDEKSIDKMMKRAQRGADFSNAELLQMQGVTYRYAQRVELATKVVEKVTGGLKQVLNTQV